MQFAQEGIDNRAHWCSGTLRMNDGFGNPLYVYNPFSYDELLQRIGPPGAIDQYLLCISQLQAGSSSSSSSSTRCEAPTIPEIEEQGVSSISVIERCKSNYQQKQWDVGSFMLYDSENNVKALRSSLLLASLLPSFPEDDAVGSCLLLARKNRESHLGCMQDFLMQTYSDSADAAKFYRYEKADPLLAATSTTNHIDACIVFSGPAKNPDNSTTTKEFQRCSHDYTDTGCMIPHMVWSSSSKNSVPVANLHTVEEVSPKDRREHAMALFADAKDLAMKSLRALQNFTDANLEVVLFSGEGDSIHQIFDCIMMGPYSRIDFWDRGAGKDLEVPFWARDKSELGIDRGMDLPCFGQKLKGDNNPPFTCGSDTRRAIIKYFVR